MKENFPVKQSDGSTIALPAHAEESSRVSIFLDLTKARLTFLVLVTTFVGFCMGEAGAWNWIMLFHSMCGTGLLAAGAAVLNQYVERDLDLLMHRTKDRPLPSGQMKPADALLLGVALSVAGLLYLAFLVNILTSFLGVITLVSYIFVYTPLKTKTPLCTLVGAVPGAIPPMMGWTAATDSLGVGAWLLFIILFLWQMPHFFALAQMYRDDYARGGFPMLSVVDPDGSRVGVQIVSHTFLLIPASIAPYFFGMTGSTYLVGAGILSVVFLVFGIIAAFKKSYANSKKLFLVSICYLPLMLILMVADKVAK
jgi:heme o synthase